MLRLTACLLLGLVLSTGSRAQSNIILTNGEWPPYLGEMLPYNGTASRIISEAFASQGMQVRWDFHAWDRAFELAQQGLRDGTAVWSSTPEREHDFYISAPVLRSGHFFYSLRERAFDWQQMDDLEGLQVGLTRSYNYGQALQKAARQGLIGTRTANNDLTNLRRLLRGQIDIFPINPVVADSLLQTHFTPEERERLVQHPKPIRQYTLHLLLSRKVLGNQRTLERFNNGLEQLWRDGRMQRYLQDFERPDGLQAIPPSANR